MPSGRPPPSSPKAWWPRRWRAYPRCAGQRTTTALNISRSILQGPSGVPAARPRRYRYWRPTTCAVKWAWRRLSPGRKLSSGTWRRSRSINRSSTCSTRRRTTRYGSSCEIYRYASTGSPPRTRRCRDTVTWTASTLTGSGAASRWSSPKASS